MIVTSIIYNNEQLNKFHSYIDAAILMSQSLGLVYENLDLDKAIFYCLDNNIIPIIGMNKMLHQQDLKVCEDIYLKYKDSSCLFYICDLGAFNLAKKYNLEQRVIYNPETMITNFKDLEIYQSFNFNAVGVSLEIPTLSVKEMYDYTKANIFYQVFGHRLMMYSKRKLISLYEEKAHIKTSHKSLYLKEVTRVDNLPIIENKNGTMIYRSYLISLIDELDTISFIKYAMLDPLYIDDENFENILNIYHNAINNNITKEEAKKQIAYYALDIKEGFTYKDSVYQKEEF